MSTEVSGALLLTATIRPQEGLPEAHRLLLDPEERLRRYIENLKRWLSKGNWPGPVVFAESSGVGLDTLRERFRGAAGEGRFEVVHAGGDEFPGAFGKGFGEALILRRAFERSQLLGAAPWVAKMTGLQRVANLARLVSRLPSDLRWMADLRDHGLYERLGSRSSGRWCDTRLFFVNAEFFTSHLAGVNETHREGHFYLEGAYYRVMKLHLGEVGIYPRFPIEPDYRGAAGHWGKNYGAPGQRAKRLLRAALRRFLPGLWI